MKSSIFKIINILLLLLIISYGIGLAYILFYYLGMFKELYYYSNFVMCTTLMPSLYLLYMIISQKRRWWKEIVISQLLFLLIRILIFPYPAYLRYLFIDSAIIILSILCLVLMKRHNKKTVGK